MKNTLCTKSIYFYLSRKVDYVQNQFILNYVEKHKMRKINLFLQKAKDKSIAIHSSLNTIFLFCGNFDKKFGIQNNSNSNKIILKIARLCTTYSRLKIVSNSFEQYFLIKVILSISFEFYIMYFTENWQQKHNLLPILWCQTF